MFLSGGLTALVVFGLFAYLPCWVFAAVFRFVLSPLEIPYTYLAARERRLMVVAYMTIFVVGIPILLLVYLIGFIRHIRSQSDTQAATRPSWMPLIPRFSMSDMLAMVLSLGCTPALYQAFQQARAPLPPLLIFFASLLTFPAFFLTALYRLNLHDVPTGGVRMALLALSPFIAVASAGILPNALISISGLPTPTITTIVFVLFLLAGRILAGRAAMLGQAATATIPMEATVES